MKRRLTLAVLTLSAFLLPAGCVSHTPIQEGELPQSQAEAPDDIILTPGGPAYRANFFQEGVENPWPPIDMTHIEIRDAGVTYRDYIETKAGESHNNIIYVSVREKDGVKSLALYSESVPEGLSLTVGDGYGAPFFKARVLIIVVSAGIDTGSYEFEIGLEINGRDYGTIPCAVKVAE